MGRILVRIAAALAALVGLGWLGLQVKPRPLAPYTAPEPALATIPLPAGLPTPVERYYRGLYGDEVPVVTSAVVTGRMWLRPWASPCPGAFASSTRRGRGTATISRPPGSAFPSCG